MDSFLLCSAMVSCGLFFFVKPSTKTVYCYTVLDNLLECKRNSKPYGVIFTVMLDCTIRAVIIFRPDTI